MDVIVLGAGRVGGAIARDLAADETLRVTAADASGSALARLRDVPGLRVRHADLGRAEELRRALRGHDLVVGALPGPMGFETLRHAIDAGCHVVDISFFEEDPFALDELARAAGRTVLVDCGVAPGCSNLILGRHAAVMDSTDAFLCLVGGLPAVRRWPWEYSAPFSPIDVIAEYTRPARLRRYGQDITLPALSDLELLEFEGVGTLEAFNTDGLRTLLHTMDTPEMIEKTLRYPGHADRIRVLRQTGFFGTEPVRAADTEVRPLDLTAALLNRAWRFDAGSEDLTVMRVEVAGTTQGRRVRHTYELLDRYDRATGTLSMARTTGFTCAAMARLVARGLYREPGVSPPEHVGRDARCFDFVMGELAARHVEFRHGITPLD
jgi:saccharopine dehydrogenase-like NADP-dependent oxidoreductase